MGLNWVCFSNPPNVHFFIFNCHKRVYVHFSVLDIGFVLHNSLINSYEIFRIAYRVQKRTAGSPSTPLKVNSGVLCISWFIVHNRHKTTDTRRKTEDFPFRYEIPD